MNADDRATQPVTGENARRQPPASVPPASGTNPQRTSLRSGQIPTRPATGETPVRPVTGENAVRSSSTLFAPAPTTGANPVAPQTAASPVTGTAPVKPKSAQSESAFGKLKGAAVRAKDEVRSADAVAAADSKGGPRKVRVLVSRVDPWSALKIGFLLSIAVGIMLVVAVYVLWNVLDAMGLFITINEWILTLFPEDSELDLMQFFDKNKIMAATTLIAVVDVVLLTALATISAFLYNVISSVVGGFYVTLTDD